MRKNSIEKVEMTGLTETEDIQHPAPALTSSPKPKTTEEEDAEHRKEVFKMFEKLDHKTDEDLKNWLQRKVRTQLTHP
jgi:hypothetical protein